MSNQTPSADVRVNDFVIRFANVNGSGSASANGMFAKALFRMGIPVAPRNLFPSNIQGLPTWFEVRVSGAGYTGRRDGVDIMVAMNAETYEEDVASIVPGGYLVYDSTAPLARRLRRDEIHLIGMPIAEIMQQTYADPKQRSLFKNVAYVGLLSELLDIEFDVITDMVSAQFKGKEKLIRPNVQALELGRDYARDHYPGVVRHRVERVAGREDLIMVSGNEAAGLGMLYGGATVCAWYPITPSTSLAEAFESHAQRLRKDPDTGALRYAILQAEDELAAIGMVVGAGWNGARAFTATSGPGLSLMQEFLGLAYFAEIPVTLVDVQRAGPSTGMPTRTQQSDVLAAVYASHGDTKHVVLLPSTPKECFDFSAAALDLADRLQTPVIVLTDLELGMNDLVSEPLEWDDARRFDRGKVLDADALDATEKFGRYLDLDGDGIGFRTYPGTHPQKGAFFTRGTSRDEYAVYTESPDAYRRNMERLLLKWETSRTLVPAPEIVNHSDAGPQRAGLIHYGTTAAAVPEAVDLLAERGVHVDTMRIRAVPFSEEVERFLADHELVFVIEQNRDAQLRTVLVNECEVDPAGILAITHYDGLAIAATDIVDSVLDAFAQAHVPVLTEVGSQ